MGAGRPQKADPGTLYAVAHQFYWDFRRLSEGRSRWFLDKKKHDQLQRHAQEVDLQLSDEQIARAREVAEEEINSGRLKESDRENRIRDIEDGQLFATREHLLFDAAEKARRERKFRSEPDVVAVLLDPKTTPERVRALCKDAFMSMRREVEPGVFKEVEIPAWPILPGSTLPGYLSQYAEQYVAALHDPRFPRCHVSKRPSSRLKQLWFVSRALAGALCGITARTAVNLVGSLRPEEVFEESRDAKPVRKQRKRRHKS